MKRLISLFLFTVFLLSICVMGVLADETVDLAVTSGCHSIDGTMSLLGSNQLVENVSSAFLYETNSQTILYQWDCDRKVNPASLVKIMTGLLVLEKGTLTDQVTVKQSALDSISYDAISVDLQAGEVISVDDLMYCMLVYSANDAAAVLAEYVAGSHSDFVLLMNERAAELGCTGTAFTNAHGLHDENQYTTARDLCKILSAALTYDAFRTYFGTSNYTVPATNLHKERNLSSNNFFINKDSVAIYYDGRVTGGRTGVTAEGLRNIASLSESGNMEVICIVTDSASKLTEYGRTEKYGGFDETIDLLDAAYSGYSRRQIIFPNQTLRQESVLNGDNDLFITSYEGFSTVLPSDISLEQLTFTYQELPGGIQAPIEKGQNVASLQVWYGSICIAQTDVFAMNDVSVAATKNIPLSHKKESISWLTVILIVILIIAIGFVAFLFVVRIRSKKLVAAQMRSSRRRRK